MYQKTEEVSGPIPTNAGNLYRNSGETFERFVDCIGGNEKLKQLIIEQKFLFGGRILSNRGVKGEKLTYSNCYVVAPPEDNIESIYDSRKHLARTYSCN